MIITATVINVLELKELDGIWHPKLILGMEWFDSYAELERGLRAECSGQ